MSSSKPVKSLTVDPCHTCQPLGAVYGAMGFARCLPLVHGSQGCVAYLRSQLTRGFRREVLAATSSLGEEAAVYGGHEVLVEAIRNAWALYRPRLMAVFSTCMAETIGDDLGGIVKDARREVKGIHVVPIPTPSYAGDHVAGHDAATEGIVRYFHETKSGAGDSREESIALVPGFLNPGDVAALKRLLAPFGPSMVVGDVADALGSRAAEGSAYVRESGATEDQIRASFSAACVVGAQRWASPKTAKLYAETLKADYRPQRLPIGVRLTDRFVHELAKVTGRGVPAAMAARREELVDVVKTCKQYLYGTRVAIMEAADLAYGLTSACLELGMVPVVVGTPRRVEGFDVDVAELASGREERPRVVNGGDLLDLEEALATHGGASPGVDVVLGSTKAKYLARRLGVPLVRVGFPMTDVVGAERAEVVGYDAMIALSERLANLVIERNDIHADGVI